MLYVKRTTGLPDFAPPTRQSGLTEFIAGLEVGENGDVPHAASTVKQACERYCLAWCDAPEGDQPIFAVWKSTSNGTAAETGIEFALVARIDAETAERFERQAPGSTITPRTARAKADAKAAKDAAKDRLMRSALTPTGPVRTPAAA